MNILFALSGQIVKKDSRKRHRMMALSTIFFAIIKFYQKIP